MKKLTAIIVGSAMLCSCADTKTSTKLNNIQMGMTRQDVVSLMGAPDSVSASSNTVYLMYHLENHNAGGRSDYYVHLKENAVDSFGRKGDFDSTQKMKERIQVEYKDATPK